MLTLESGIVKGKKIISCKYYELEEKCKSIIEEYCNISPSNLLQFQEFSKNYSTFKPYFDFVLNVLGYNILNPQMEEGKVLVGKENHMYVYKKEQNEFEKNFRYGLSDDITLNIYPMTIDSSAFHDCLINGDNNHILPSDMLGHTQILQQILNLLLISNKEICEEYLHYSSDIGFFVQRYLPIIRFQADRQGPLTITRCAYRKNNITKKQELFMNELLDNRYTYPSFLMDVGRIDDFQEVKDLSKEVCYKIGQIKIHLNNHHKKIVIINAVNDYEQNLFVELVSKYSKSSLVSIEKSDFSFDKLLNEILNLCESAINIILLPIREVTKINEIKNMFGGGY